MFSLLHASRSQSIPVFLYEITYAEGTAGLLFYTSAERPLELGGAVYEAVQIRHDEITATGSLDKTTVALRTPRTSPLVDLFRVHPPERVVTVLISQGELNCPIETYRAIWFGRILNFGLEGLEATFTCEPASTALRRAGLRRTYQYGCPHVLYGPQCQASKAAASREAQVEAVDGAVVTLEADWHGEHAAAKYIRGTLEWALPEGGGPVRRSILQVGDIGDGPRVLSLNGFAPELAAEDTVTVVLGCNRQLSDCQDVHDNILNFGGQPWIAEVTPFGSFNIFF